MKIVYAALTDKGKKRSRNEDYFYAKYPVFVVADGLGGHRAGEVASRTAVLSFVKSIEEKYGNLKDLDSLSTLLKESIQMASEKILRKSTANAELKGMGTTISAAVLFKNTMVVAHVGDSRIYLLRKGELKQITKDHTYVQMLVDRGEISQEEAKEHPMKNALLQALGGETSLDIEVKAVKLKPEDVVLLCTDGLYNLVDDAQIVEVLESRSSTVEKAKKLVSMALRAGGLDNVTVVILEAKNGSD